jgi:vacuolar protein-sorting-associated protein 4
MSGTDRGHKRLDEARSLLTQAIHEDRSQRLDAAKQLYTEAQLRFQWAQNELTLKAHERQFASQKIEGCRKRISELSALQTEALKAESQRAPPAPVKKLPVEPMTTSEVQDQLLSAILVEKPNVHWDDIAGLAEAKRQLIQTVILPAKIPHFFTGARVPWRGILLYGPPGTGKSYLAKATATEACDATFLTVATSDLLSKWMGESEKLIRSLFETARARTPSVVFIDEIDALLTARGSGDSETSRRIKSEFLVQMDGVGKSQDGVLVLAATNTPWAIDSAARRRFEKRIYIPLPDRETRVAMLQIKIRKMQAVLTDADVETIADRTEGFSGADIHVLCRDAAMTPLNRIQSATHFREKNGVLWPCRKATKGSIPMTVMDMTEEQLAKLKPADVGIKDFLAALERTKPTVSQSDLDRFEEWTREFGQEGN